MIRVGTCLLAAFLLVGFAACGGGGNETNVPPKDNDIGNGHDDEEEDPPPPSPEVHEVVVTPSQFELIIGENQLLEVKVIGEGDFDDSVVWETSDPTLATVKDGLVEALEEGEVTITATSVFDSTRSGGATLTVLPLPPTTGTMVVVIEDLPSHFEAGIDITDPDGEYFGSAHATITFEEVPPGTYTLTARDLDFGGLIFTPSAYELEVEVQAGETSTVEVAYEETRLELFTLEMDTVTLPIAGKAEGILRATRHHGFEGPIQVTFSDFPKGVMPEAPEIYIEARQPEVAFAIASDGSFEDLRPTTFKVQGDAEWATFVGEGTFQLQPIVTNASDSGPGSLRHLVEAAPRIQPPTPVFEITFEEWYFKTMEESEILLSTPLELPSLQDRTLRIRGPVDDEGNPFVRLVGVGGKDVRVLQVPAGKVEISNLIVTSGSVDGGGGILNAGDLLLKNVWLKDNVSSGEGGAIDSGVGSSLHIEDCLLEGNKSTLSGGAIHTQGALTLLRSTIKKNLSSKSGAGIYLGGNHSHSVSDSIIEGNNTVGEGGGILNLRGTLLVEDSTIVENKGFQGAGIYHLGTLTLQRAKIQANRAGYRGGGIHITSEDDTTSTALMTETRIEGNVSDHQGAGISSMGDVEIEGGSIVGNDAAADGGGAFILEGSFAIRGAQVEGNKAKNGGGFFLDAAGSLAVSSSALVENSASEKGGGFYLGGASTVRNTTVVQNSAVGEGGGIYVGEEGDLLLQFATVAWNVSNATGSGLASDGSLHLRASIVAGNQDSPSTPDFVASQASAPTSSGANLLGEILAQSFVQDPSDQVGVAPLLDPPTSDGSPTTVSAPGPSSPAIDGVTEASCTYLDDEVQVPLLEDQRGEERPKGLGCDIGAIEVQP